MADAVLAESTAHGRERALTVGALFLLLALVLFFLLGVGVPVVPRAEYWAFFSLVLGLLLAGYPLPPWPRA
jgi:hypothetical protein